MTQENTPSRLVEDFLAAGFELIETHISLVFLGEKDVYKVKKAVDFGFLDFSTLDKRHAACEKEVVLNRRLAGDVYLGVVPIVAGLDGSLVFGGSGEAAGEAVEWAVHMRRLGDENRADNLLKSGELTPKHVALLAETVARFHADCRVDEETSRYGSVELIGTNVTENFEQTRALIGAYLDPDAVVEIERWQVAFLEDRKEQFEARVKQGHVRDGHGDLRLEHVYFEPEGDGIQVVVLDCIEFNDRFRYADVCADIAFLAMDLAASGAVGLSEAFLADYAQHANDYDFYPLVDFYESYRAFVRGKVLAITEHSEGSGGSKGSGRQSTEQKERLHKLAHKHFVLAQASERRPVRPARLVAVGGWIASGKSTIAEQLGRQLGYPVIAADWTRKWLLGRQPAENVHDAAFAGAYSPTMTARAYRELVRRAHKVLDSGRGVILDATFRDRRQRSLVRRVAAEQGAEFLFVECRADESTCKSRLRDRQKRASVSDGRLEIFDAFVASWEPVTELPPAQHLVLDTARSLEESVSRIRDAVHPWLPVPPFRV